MTAVEAYPTAGAVGDDFVDCYLQHYGRLVRALRLSGADPGSAEEIAQEAFARALVHWGRVRRGANPTGYVYTTGFRLLHRHLSRAARWDLGEPPEGSGGSSPGHPDRTGSEAALNVSVASVLDAMPPRRRACAVMCLVVGLTSEEAGHALGLAAGTVRKHLEEARRQLAQIGD